MDKRTTAISTLTLSLTTIVSTITVSLLVIAFFLVRLPPQIFTNAHSGQYYNNDHHLSCNVGENPAGEGHWIRSNKTSEELMEDYKLAMTCPHVPAHGGCPPTYYPNITEWEWKGMGLLATLNDDPQLYVPHNKVALRTVSDVVHHCLANKTINFLGDLMNRQIVQSMLCQIHKDGYLWQHVDLAQDDGRTVILAHVKGGIDAKLQFYWEQTLIQWDLVREDVLVKPLGGHFVNVITPHAPEVLVLNAGHWLNPATHRNTSYDFFQAYVGAINATAEEMRHICTKDSTKPLVIFRNVSPPHFHGGGWQVGNCVPGTGPRFNQ
ncbi:hypothetical protein HDU76_011240, partial [Blyttiomyces sp. JEL0837]